MTLYAITDTKKGEQGLRLLMFKLPEILIIKWSTVLMAKKDQDRDSDHQDRDQNQELNPNRPTRREIFSKENSDSCVAAKLQNRLAGSVATLYEK